MCRNEEFSSKQRTLNAFPFLVTSYLPFAFTVSSYLRCCVSLCFCFMCRVKLRTRWKGCRAKRCSSEKWEDRLRYPLFSELVHLTEEILSWKKIWKVSENVGEKITFIHSVCNCSFSVPTLLVHVCHDSDLSSDICEFTIHYKLL